MFRWTLHLTGATQHYRGAVVAVQHKLYRFEWSRHLNTDQIAVRVFNTVSLRWRTLSPETCGRGERHPEIPSRRSYHIAVPLEDTIYVWGGHPYCDVLYAYDVDAHRWFKPTVYGTVPEARYRHSACVVGKVIFIHGGYTQLTGYTNDMYKLDTSTMVWSVINTRGTPPPVSRSHSATVIGTKMYVFGGYEERVPYHTIRVFDTETNHWLSTPSTQPLPEGRYGHSAFTYNGELYIISGYVDSNDVWKFISGTFSWKKVESKGKGLSMTYGMCCCMVGDRIFLFEGDYNASNDLHILDLSPSLKTLCKLAVIQYGLDQFELPHGIKWELRAMTNKHNGNYISLLNN